MNVLMIDTAHRIYWDDLPNTLKALQQAVGGYIEVVPLTEQLCVICNEESKLLGLPPVAVMPARHDVRCGPLVICRTTPDGEFTDTQDEDLYTIEKYLVLAACKKKSALREWSPNRAQKISDSPV